MTKPHVLILATDGFEQAELFEPRRALLDAGAQVTLASPALAAIQGMEHDEKGDTIAPDLTLADVDVTGYDALLLPGGVANPDTLRAQPRAVALVRAFADAGKPIAAICHAPWLLVEADLLRGRTATGYPSIRTDMRNAGADVVDREVVVDGGIITSRDPNDIPAFNAALLEAVGLKVSEPA